MKINLKNKQIKVANRVENAGQNTQITFLKKNQTKTKKTPNKL